MISKKVKELLVTSGKRQQDLANEWGLSRQSMSRKMVDNVFTTKDLVRVADLCQAELCFITKDGQKISLTLEDIEKKEK